ncbi:AAA family ATPase [Rhodopseudomonas pseudopalustris]|uniref:AAA family ATPase n=1 Tax=Rhodopseudomonas pseudopalustris TaxID=1513892 RepID=UPI003F9C5255
MKLIRAEFENFRLLRHLKLDLSTDEHKKLTVIRAENETGKTTILNALQWALYGDDALPGKGQDFRLHPIDWDISEGRRVAISVQVEFETTTVRKSPKGLIETTRQYRIIRTANETLEGIKWDRGPSTVRLYHLTDTGSVPIDPPEAAINDELPPELREVFFTDGDRALSFIEASVSLSTKRERVQKAIRSLLGLGVIEEARRHVKKAASDVNKAAKGAVGDSKLTEITTKVDQIDKDAAELEGKINDAKDQFRNFDEMLADIQKKIDVALVKGDREKLKKDIEQAEKQLRQVDNQIGTATKDHSDLFRSLSLGRDLLGPVLEKGLTKLSELEQQGRIPNTTIPVLEDRLKGSQCICGESLDPNDADGQRRREHIQHLVDASRKADELQSRITDLYYGSRTLQADVVPADERWLAEYGKVVVRRDELSLLRADQGKKLKALEAQLDEIPDTDIQGLRDTKRKYTEQRDRFNSDRSRYETQLEGLRREREALIAQRDNILREQKKGARILAELTVTQDVESVLTRAYDRITNEELRKVSDLMNSIFLEMIGADPDQGAIIRKAEISKEFDILVYGPNDRALNPDRDLNGASRRALTLAFILALTKVSDVVAPNVIDTPLGMMSGYVKRSVLRTAIRESSQLVLFLTRSEIADCEEILDTEAGRIITLTNPAHYPRMLVNDPHVRERTVLRCECDHRHECKQCQRRLDAAVELEMAS